MFHVERFTHLCTKMFHVEHFIFDINTKLSIELYFEIVYNRGEKMGC